MTSSATRNDSASGEVASVMDDLDRMVEGRDSVALGEIVEALGSRGHGPLLMVFGALLILPLAMVPGLPAIIGLLVVLVGVEILRADKGIWLPGVVREREVPAGRLRRSLEKAEPYSRRFRRALKHRLTEFTDARASLIAISMIVMVTGVAIIVAGFIPGLPFILAIHLILFGLGLTARDGAVVLAGYVWLLPAILLSIYLF